MYHTFTCHTAPTDSLHAAFYSLLRNWKISATQWSCKSRNTLWLSINFQYLRLVTYYAAISPPLTLLQSVSFPCLSSFSFLQQNNHTYRYTSPLQLYFHLHTPHISIEWKTTSLTWVRRTSLSGRPKNKILQIPSQKAWLIVLVSAGAIKVQRPQTLLNKTKQITHELLLCR